MRKCKHCGEIKDFEDFYPGNKSRCKKCSIKRSNLWMKDHPQRVKEYRAKLLAKRKADPGYRKKQADFYREWYAKHGRNRAKNQLEIVRLWRELNPEKCRTYWLVQTAVKQGKLKKPKHCSNCNLGRKLVGHHDDYEFPFKVRWLCYSCHKKEHNKLK